ncbi:MAG: tRNA (adenosine(37)-N6)-dimethylallyltransferase MiaA, partial [Candidatus Limnocylindrales bacterium]|nr:tRNA (adenosine(37)-N6)-dimethylallyltransferase MiaA [Candidatus Limnocylindrales bacterium]
ARMRCEARSSARDSFVSGAHAGAPPLIVVAGATATGKTELAIRLAESIERDGRPVAIISADSRQVYRGLDIGTAKASTADRARIPHHGLDLVDPDEAFSVANFAEHARGMLADLAGSGGVAILAGGTGLYLRAVGRGLDTAALPSDPEVRARLEAELIADGLAPLAERLQAVAPTLAARVELRNPRRVVRALEMAELGGDVLPPRPRGYPGPIIWLGLVVESGPHAARIAIRAQAQFDAGLIEEARSLRERFDPTLPAFSAIGYREAWAVIDRELTRDAAIELDAQRNVAFARRQRTWFRSEPGITWLDATEELPTAPAIELARQAIEPGPA